MVYEGGYTLNNKRLGNSFEVAFCHTLNDMGYWVHFITPNKAGAQPFDVIAVKNGKTLACDCKTSCKPIFPFSRLEDNQVFAFEKWLACGNTNPKIAVLWESKVYLLDYRDLKEKGKIDLRQKEVFYEC